MPIVKLSEALAHSLNLPARQDAGGILRVPEMPGLYVDVRASETRVPAYRPFPLQGQEREDVPPAPWSRL